MLASGQRLAGYEILDTIGWGGMGVVYRARQVALDRPVALKVLSGRLAADRAFRERFRREGIHAARLDHPNIVPVYEAGEVDGTMFIAMRLIDGGSLADRMSEGVSGREVLRILEGVAGALDLAHAAGLVHRDVKPQNILLGTDGRAYIADFGISRGAQTTGLTHPGGFVGSVHYAAPEQVRGEGPVTAAADVYAVTAVMFHCLTGLPPFDRDTEAAVLYAHLTADPPALTGLDPTAPPTLDAAIRRGMSKDPDERYARAGELVADARRCLHTLDPRALDGRRPLFPAAGLTPAGGPATPPRAAVAVATTPVADEVGLAPPAPRRAAATTPGTDEGRLAPAPAHGAAEAQPLPGDRRADGEPRDLITLARPRRPVWAWLGAAVAVAVLAGLGGAALRGTRPAPAAFVQGAFSVHYSAPWTRVAAAPGAPGLRFAGSPLTLTAQAGGTRVFLVAGAVGRVAGPAHPIPTSLARGTAGGRAAPARLGGAAGVIYRGRLRRGGARLYAAFLTDGAGNGYAVACRSAGTVAATALAALCGPVARTAALTPPAGAASAIPSAVAGTRLQAALATLAAGRVRRDAKVLASGTADGPALARAAGGLARVLEAVSKRVRPLGGSVPLGPAAASLARALSASSTGYAALATELRADRAAAAARAAQAAGTKGRELVRARARLVAALRRAGYRVRR